MKPDLIKVDRKVFLDLCAATEEARAYLAHNAPCNAWANRVRINLFNANRAGVQQVGLPLTPEARLVAKYQELPIANVNTKEQYGKDPYLS